MAKFVKKNPFDIIEIDKFGKVISQSSLPKGKGIVPFTKYAEANKFNRLKAGDKLFKTIKAIKLAHAGLAVASNVAFYGGAYYLTKKLLENKNKKKLVKNKDAQWITIRGRHVMVPKNGKINFTRTKSK